MIRFLAFIAALLFAAPAFAEEIPYFWYVTDPPLLTNGVNTYTASGGTVTRASGSRDLPTWMKEGCRVEIPAGSGNYETVTAQVDVDEFTIDDAGLSETGVQIAYGAAPSYPHDGVDDQETLQRLFDMMTTLTPLGGVVVFPPSDPRYEEGDTPSNYESYRLDSKLTIYGTHGLKILGGGTAREARTQTGTGGNPQRMKYPALTWMGGAGAAGPMVEIRDAAGTVIEGLAFVGIFGTNTVDQLVRYNNTGDSNQNNNNVHALRDCGFHDAKVAMWVESDTGTLNSEFLIENCVFKMDHAFDDDTTAAATEAAIVNNSEQSKNYTILHTEFLSCNIIMYMKESAPTRMWGCSSNLCSEVVRRENGSQNTSSVSVRDLYIDRQDNRRLILYRSTGASGRNWGNVTFENVRFAASFPGNAEEHIAISAISATNLQLARGIKLAVGDVFSFYTGGVDDLTAFGTTATITAVNSDTNYDIDTDVTATITTSHHANENNLTGHTALESYTGNTIEFVDDINIRPGDYIAFTLSSDYNDRQAITQITSQTDSRTYEVADTASDLGLTSALNAGTLRACDGTPMFLTTGGERIDVRNVFFDPANVNAKRLAQVTHGTQGGSDRNAFFSFENCNLPADVSPDLARRYLDMNGTPSWFRFRDCGHFAVGTPFSYTNIPAATVASAPTADDDGEIDQEGDGWPLGSMLVDSDGDRVYWLVDNTDGAAKWVISSSYPATAPPAGDPGIAESLIWQFRRGPEVVGTNRAIIKQPSEELTIAGNFAELLGDTQSLEASPAPVVSAAANTGVTITDVAVEGNYVTMTVTGGNNGQSGPVEITITHSGGNTVIAQGILTIQN